MSDDPLRYRHTQIGYLTILGLVGGGLSQLGAAARDIRAGRRRVWSYLPASLVFLASMLMISSLTRRGERRCGERLVHARPVPQDGSRSPTCGRQS